MRLSVGKSMSKMMSSKALRRSAAVAGYGSMAAYGFNRGVNTNGALTNAFLETSLGSADIDNQTFGEDIGLWSDLRATHLGTQVTGSKYIGAGIGAGIGATPGLIGAFKAKGKFGKMAGLGAALVGGGMGATAGYAGGAVAPLMHYARGPIGTEFTGRSNSTVYTTSQKPIVDGSIVFGAYNQRYS